MSDIDIDGAAEALSSMLPDSYEEPVVVEESDSIGDDQPVEESFTGFNPADLPEDMQLVYKSMQADYTRKTQELAEWRNKMGALSSLEVDPDEAVRMINFVQQLDSDPAFAEEFVSHVTQQLNLNNRNQNAIDGEPVVEETNYDGIPPELARELEEMRQFRSQMQEAQAIQELEQQLLVQEQTIKTANPQFSDEDMEAVYSLAHATDGDLLAAADMYHAIQQRLLGNYLQAKQVPYGATSAPGGPSMVPSKEFSSLDEAHKAAMESLRNIS